MRVVRWVVAGLVVGALVAFVAELMRPRPGIAGSSGYVPPVPATDHRVVLPG
jgi:hypothetical protein